MVSLPSASEGVGLGAGLLGGYASSNYQNYLGNTINQVLAGNQFKNVFGTGLNSFLDIARVWQDCDWVTTPFSFEDTPTSLAWKKWQDRFGKLGIDLGVINPEKDEKTGKTPWAGWTSLNVGDVSTLNYKGNLIRVNRGVCQINYTTTQDLPLQWAAVEAKVRSYFWWIWGVGIASMVVFQLYNTKVCQNQEVQEKIDGNMTWKLINIALELVQFLVLKKMASYQQEWTTEIMELEIDAASTLKLDDSEILVTMDKMKALESVLLGQMLDASDEIARLQTLSGASLQNIAKAANESALAMAKNQAAQQAQFAALVKANREAQFEALVAEGVSPAIAESQLKLLTELCAKAQVEADMAQESMTLAEEEISALQEALTPIENLQVSSANCDSTEANASGGTALNPGLSGATEAALSASTLISQQVQLRGDSARLLAQRYATALQKVVADAQNRENENAADVETLQDSTAAQDDVEIGGGSLFGKAKRFLKFGDTTKKRSYGPTLFERLFG
jgi:hypothetical protein